MKFGLIKSSTLVSGLSKGIPQVTLKEIKEEEIDPNARNRDSDSFRTESECSDIESQEIEQNSEEAGYQSGEESFLASTGKVEM